jgi:hypothetical protein
MNEEATWETGLFKIKKPTIPPTPSIPVFDYIVDIYSDKVVVTNPDGSTTQLSTISDLNSWLRNITGKRIRINANVEVYNDIYLSPNEYWIFGEWIRGKIYLLSGKHTIISFTRLGDLSNRSGIFNYDLQLNEYTDVSGSRIYSVYANLYLQGTDSMILNNILVYLVHASECFITYVRGSVYIINGGYISLTNSTLYDVFVDADELFLGTIASDGTGTWTLISRYTTYFGGGGVDASQVYDIRFHFTITRTESLLANTSKTITLPSISGTGMTYKVVFIGVYKRTPSHDYICNPLPSEVTYQLDATNKTLTIQNGTTSPQDIYIVIEMT